MKLKPNIFSALVVCALLISPVSAGYSLAASSSDQNPFTVPSGLETKVKFWTKVYSEYTTGHAILHDTDRLDIVYEVVYLGDQKISRRARDRKMNRYKKKYRKILHRVARTKDKSTLTGEDKRVYDLVKAGFNRAARNIRVQIGQKDRFREGLERSGLYMDKIRKIFRKHELPVDLSVLPHVESSFQVKAYSSAGAAGIWQFTRGTGRRFMKVGYTVDERMDPILATDAAARLLKYNYKELNSWPLAITAYNHGLQGMKRARKRYGDDMVKVINYYRSRTFGFASKNFYAEFLAALHVVKNKDKYFPNLKIEKPLKTVSVRFKDYIHVRTAMQHFNMTRDELMEFNPALRRPVISGQKRIPKGFVFQAPAEKYAAIEKMYKAIPVSYRHSDQIRSKWYTVRRGDTLSAIAVRFRTSVRQLKRLNNVGRRNRIYVGQVLRLPEGKSSQFQMASAKATGKEYTGETMLYRVRRHDNLSKIAHRFGTDPGELARLNKIKNPDRLHPGQRLKVPQALVVAKAVEKIRKEPDLGVKESKPASKKYYLKVDKGSKNSSEGQIRKKAKKLIPAGQAEIQPVEKNHSIDKLNRNRPAFLPVAFASEKQKSSNIGVITVDFDETLSHYAEWARLPVNQLRRLNGLQKRAAIPVHAQIQVPFTNTTPEQFTERRQEYHKAIQEDFFNNYRVSKLLVRSVGKGETLWEICNEIYFIPFWLLSGYNPDKDVHALSVGEPLVIPMITPTKTKDT